MVWFIKKNATVDIYRDDRWNEDMHNIRAEINAEVSVPLKQK